MFLLNYRETVCILQAIEKIVFVLTNYREFPSYRETVCSHQAVDYRETLFYHQTIEKLCFLQAVEKF